MGPLRSVLSGADEKGAEGAYDVEEAVDLVESMLQRAAAQRISAADAKLHPLFWEPDMRMRVLRRVSEKVNGSGKSAIQETFEKHMRQRVEFAHARAVYQYLVYSDSTNLKPKVKLDKNLRYRDVFREVHNHLSHHGGDRHAVPPHMVLRLCAGKAPGLLMAAVEWEVAYIELAESTERLYSMSEERRTQLAQRLDEKLRKLLAKAVKERSKEHKERDSAAATALCTEADSYSEQCKYAQALELYEWALAIKTATLGAEHPSTGATLGSMAGVHKAQGSYAQALELFERALAIQTATLGEGHPDTGATLGSMARVHEAQGSYAQALELYERALAIETATLGAEHPDTAATLTKVRSVRRKALPM